MAGKDKEGRGCADPRRKKVKIRNAFQNHRKWPLVMVIAWAITTTSLVACSDISGQEESEQASANNATVDFRACVVSKEDAEAMVRKFPSDKERYDRYFGQFKFSKKRQCYTQRWVMPARLKGMSTEGKAGSEYVRISFPPRINGERQRNGYVEGLEGKGVVARPIAPSLTFADSNKFRKEDYPENTGQFFGKYEVWAYKEESIHKALIDREGSELYAFVTLKDAAGMVSKDNVDWIIIKSNLDDRYELSYVLPPRQLNEIEELDQQIKSQIHTYLKNRTEN